MSTGDFKKWFASAWSDFRTLVSIVTLTVTYGGAVAAYLRGAAIAATFIFLAATIMACVWVIIFQRKRNLRTRRQYDCIVAGTTCYSQFLPIDGANPRQYATDGISALLATYVRYFEQSFAKYGGEWQASIWIPEIQGGAEVLVIHTCYRLGDQIKNGYKMGLGAGLANGMAWKVWTQQVSMHSDDAQRDDRVDHSHGRFGGVGSHPIGSLACDLIVQDGFAYGVLVVDHQKPRMFNGQESTFRSSYGRMFAPLLRALDVAGKEIKDK